MYTKFLISLLVLIVVGCISLVNPKLLPVAHADTLWFDSMSLQTLASFDSGPWANVTQRIVFNGSALTKSGAKTRLTLNQVAGAGESVTITSMYIGTAALAGDAYDFDTTPVQVTVGGSNSFTVTAGASVVTDAINFNLDDTRNIVVSFYITTADTTADTVSFLNSSVASTYTRTGNEAATVDATTGYNSNSSLLRLVTRIEIGLDEKRRIRLFEGFRIVVNSGRIIIQNSP